jgi:acyl-CoA-dependent ceramide synthase
MASDTNFQLAKMFRYLSLNSLCDMTFSCFLLSWFITRHVLFNIVIWSTYYDGPRLVPFMWEPDIGHYWCLESYIAFTSMLSSLQVRALTSLLVTSFDLISHR